MEVARKDGKIVGIEKQGLVMLLEHEDTKVRLGLRLKQVRDWIEFETAPYLARIADTGIRPKADEAEEPKPAEATATADGDKPADPSPSDAQPDAASDPEPTPAADGASVPSN